MSNVRALINYLNGVLQAKSIGPAISDAIDTAQKIGVRLNDLQDVASFSEENITPNFHRVEITMLMQGALKDLQSTSAELQVSIKTEIPTGLPRVLASENLIMRALKILIRQAMSFSTAGGAVKVWAAKEEDAVAVFISNVSAKSEQAIHEAWIKGEKPNVGLAFCTHTIQDHGGTIGVATMADGSSAMRLTLPTLHEVGTPA
jgi:K+-sensing histidine kinase KdpD